MADKRERGGGDAGLGGANAGLARAPQSAYSGAVAAAANEIRARVLFMDDEEPIRAMTTTLLEGIGLEVTVVNDGDAAVRDYARARESGQPYDLVIFDLTVAEGMNGLQAMQEILKLDAGAKGIVSSGYANHPVTVNFRAHGFRASVPKPYRMADFARTVREVLAAP